MVAVRRGLAWLSASVMVTFLPRERLAFGGSGLIFDFFPTVLIVLVLVSFEDEDDGSPGPFSCCNAATSCTLDVDDVVRSDCAPTD